MSFFSGTGCFGKSSVCGVSLALLSSDGWFSGQQLDLLNQITSLVLKDIQNWRGLPCVSATCALFAGAMINLEHKAVLPHLKVLHLFAC